MPIILTDIIHCPWRYEFEVTDKDLERMLLDFGGNLTVPENFEHTALPLDQKGPSAANEVGVSYFSFTF